MLVESKRHEGRTPELARASTSAFRAARRIDSHAKSASRELQRATEFVDGLNWNVVRAESTKSQRRLGLEAIERQARRDPHSIQPWEIAIATTALRQSIEASERALQKYSESAGRSKLRQGKLPEDSYADRLLRLRDKHDNLLIVSNPIDQERVAYYLGELSSRASNTISLVRQNSCGSCGKRLSTYTIDRMLTDSHFTHCPKCRKILCQDSIRGFVPKKRVAAKVSAKLDWEVLPEGWWLNEDFIERLKVSRGRFASSGDVDRLLKIASLKPAATYEGLHLGRRQYFVFEFEHLTVAECWLNGNALYYCHDADWRVVFCLTKREALDAGARRLVHRGDWFDRVRSIVARTK